MTCTYFIVVFSLFYFQHKTCKSENSAECLCRIQLSVIAERGKSSDFIRLWCPLFLICGSDILPETFELFTSPNTTNYTVSDTSLYITWTGLPPWYGILTSANLVIRVEDNFILRYQYYFVFHLSPQFGFHGDIIGVPSQIMATAVVE